jgi:hypothetical protein
VFCACGRALTIAAIPCRWCGRAFELRRGGSPRVFCRPGCRTAFHTAARRWAEDAVAFTRSICVRHESVTQAQMFLAALCYSGNFGASRCVCTAAVSGVFEILLRQKMQCGGLLAGYFYGFGFAV